MEALNDLRQDIDALDAQLAALYRRRMDVAARIAAVKREQGLPVLQPEREQEIRAQLAELAGNPAAVFLLPFPCAFQEFLPSQIVLVNAFFLQLFDDFYFRCNAGVIRSRLPECIIALHTLKTYQDILHGIVQGVSHMELSRNIRRGHHNGEGLFAPIHLGMKIFLFHPFLIQPVLNSMRIICFCKFFTHSAPFCVQAAFQSEFFKARKKALCRL